MQFKGKFLFLIFILFGLSVGASVFAASGTCPTDNGAGVVCSGGTPYYCLASCRAQAQCPSWTGTVCATGLTCPANCDGADSCGYCNSCSNAGATYGRTLCGAYPSQTCKDNLAVPTGCTTYSQCTNTCSACAAGYELIAGSCVGASVKLGIDSVLSDRLKNSTNPLMTILASGYLGIGTTAPNDYFSIGNSGSAPAGSSATGHNYTSTYLSSDDYALTNYGIVKTLIAAATSSLPSGVNFWGGAKNGNIWNGDAGVGNVGIGTTTPLEKLDVAGNIHLSAGNYIQFGTAGLHTLITDDASNGRTSIRARSNILDILLANGTAWGTIRAATLAGSSGASGNLTLDSTSHATKGFVLINPTGGNVGIGTTTPAYKLTVVGTSYLNGQITTGLSGTGNRCLYVDATGNVSAKSVDCGTATGGDNMGDHTATQNILLGNYWLSGDGGNEGLFVNSVGNVGIGTTTPSANLEIKNTSGSGNIFTITNSSGNTAFTIDNAMLQARFWIGSAANPGITSGVDPDTGLFWTSPYNILGFSVGGSEKMRINPSGNVGIGTTAPNDIFSIGNSGVAPAGSSNTGHNYTSTYLSTDDYALANYGIVKTLIASATSSLPTAVNFWGGTLNGNIWNGAAGAGNVGIGTTSPLTKLHVEGDLGTGGGQGMRLRNTNASGYTELVIANNTDRTDGDFVFGYGGTTSASATNAAYFVNRNATPISFWTNNLQRMTLDGTGNIGIGTTTPSQKLELNGDGVRLRLSTVSSPATYYFDIQSNYNSTDTVNFYATGGDNILKWIYNTDTVALQPTGGKVGIGTTAPNDIFSIGNSGAAPAGSSNTGHNYTSTYLNTDDYALANYGIVKTLIASATSSLPAAVNFWGGTKNGTIYNGDAGAGNVGIGTTTPGYKLTVVGTSYLNGQITTALSGAGNRCLYVDAAGNVSAKGVDCGTATGGDNMGDHTATQNILLGNYWLSGDGGNEGVFVNANGNVGISTTTPGYKLTVAGTTYVLGNSTFNGTVTLPTQTASRVLFTDASNNITSSALSSVVLNSITDETGSGVLVFGTAPTFTTSIITPITYGSSAANGVLTLQGNSAAAGNTTTNANLSFKVGNSGGTTAMTILNDGNIGIGTTDPNDIFSIGNSGSAPAGSSNTGHNYTSTYLATDNYALANYGIVRTLIAAATSTMPNGNYLPLAGGTMTGDVNFGAKNITNLNNLTVSKITATTIDPLYNINGINYSTFAPSVVGGVKEELVGKADIKRFNNKLDEYEYIINFSLEDEGSDLWVWRKVVDYSDDNVLVFVTPSGKFADVYYKIENNKLIFRSDRPVEVSYRLIGNRHDWRTWPTKAINQEQTGVIIK